MAITGIKDGHQPAVFQAADIGKCFVSPRSGISADIDKVVPFLLTGHGLLKISGPNRQEQENDCDKEWIELTASHASLLHATLITQDTIPVKILKGLDGKRNARARKSL
jgi:hypothetical protein